MGVRTVGRRGRLRGFDLEQAVHSALRVFWEYGYEGATLAVLKSAMGGICSPSFYSAFGSKEALFLKVLDLYWAAELVPVLALLEAQQASNSVYEFLRHSALRYTREDKPKGCLVDLGVAGRGGASRGVQPYLQGVRKEIFNRIRGCLATAQQQGSIDPAADLQRLACLLVTLRQGLSLQARDGATREQLLWVVEDATELWRMGLRAGAQNSVGV